MKKDSKQKIITNLKKVHSHVEKIIKMVDEDKYCIDIMQQNLAVIGLLKSAHQQLFERHLHTCFSVAMETNNKKKKREMLDEILKVTKLANK